MNPEVRVDCPFCSQSFWTNVDFSSGADQELDIDCEICCHALVLKAHFNAETDETEGTTEKAF